MHTYKKGRHALVFIHSFIPCRKSGENFRSDRINFMRFPSGALQWSELECGFVVG